MRWFRSHRRPWAWIALLALAMQLGLSFGHVHELPDGHPAMALVAPAQAGTPTDVGHPDDDYCATCAILALLSGAQAAGAPTIIQAVATPSAEINVAVEVPRVISPGAAFRSRAPPLS